MSCRYCPRKSTKHWNFYCCRVGSFQPSWKPCYRPNTGSFEKVDRAFIYAARLFPALEAYVLDLLLVRGTELQITRLQSHLKHNLSVTSFWENIRTHIRIKIQKRIKALLDEV